MTGTTVVRNSRPVVSICAHQWQFLRATADGQRDVFYCARCLEKCEVKR